MTLPWIPVEPLAGDVFAQIRRRAIFDCCKWDPQVGDACSIARHPLVLTRAAWTTSPTSQRHSRRRRSRRSAELVQRPALHRALGLPWTSGAHLRRAASIGASCGRGASRPLRFSFHDRRLAHLRSEHRRAWRVERGLGLSAARRPALCMDDVGRRSGGEYAKVLAAHVDGRGTVALVHATAFSDDQQMMLFVARHLQAAGLTVHLASPSHLRWHGGRASLSAEWWTGPLDLVVRFFPADWLGGLAPNQPGGRIFSPAPGRRSAIRPRRFSRRPSGSRWCGTTSSRLCRRGARCCRRHGVYAMRPGSRRTTGY